MAASGYADAVLADGPFVYVRMDGGESPLGNVGSGTNDLAVTGAQLGVAGAMVGSKAASFDGIDDKGAIAVDLSDTDVVTLEMWLWWDAYATDDDLACEFTPNWNSVAGGFIVDPNSSAEADTVSVGWTGSSAGSKRRYTFSRSALPAGGWHHLVLVMAVNAALVAYVDGEPVEVTGRETANQTGTFAASALNVMCRNGANLFGAGDVDELAVYKAALSAGRVAAHYQAALAVEGGATSRLLLGVG